MRRPLGKGLSALLSESDEEYRAMDTSLVQSLPVEHITPNPDQPRQYYDSEQLDELAASIKRRGILQPILVRQVAPSSYQIVAGERRWRAAKSAGLEELPCVIRSFDDAETFEIALMENLQRQDLTPIEEAKGYRDLQQRFGHSQESLAGIVHKSRSHVANMMRLLQLPPDVQTLLEEKKLTTGHGKLLIGRPDAQQLAATALQEKWSVRQLEQHLQQRELASPQPENIQTESRSSSTRMRRVPEIVQIEQDIQHHLGVGVRITERGQQGWVSLQYRTKEELEALVSKILT